MGAAPEDIEDACQFAWVQFFRYQPARDRNWQAWLYRTAQREAWRLTAVRRSEVRIESDKRADGRDTTEEPPDPRDRLDERIEFLSAMQELSRLSIRMQQTVIVRSQVRKQIEVAEVLGISVARVNYLLRRASEKLDEMATRRSEMERPVASPRAARLRELEDDPPTWLTEAIGRAPSRNKTSAYAVLAWRRAALAIDDYRREHGWQLNKVALGPQPSDPAARRAHARADMRSNRCGASGCASVACSASAKSCRRGGPGRSSRTRRSGSSDPRPRRGRSVGCATRDGRLNALLGK